jgi:hypothetical protein
MAASGYPAITVPKRVAHIEQKQPILSSSLFDIYRLSKMYSLALKALAAAVLSSAIAAPQGFPSSQGERSSHGSLEENVSSSAQPLSAFDWSKGAVDQYEIHQSCNTTETLLLRQALTETEILAAHARDHIQRFGNSSSYYTKYFGQSSTAEPAGWYDRLINGDKAGVIFRCDDPDQNCATQDGK